jgi:NTP pyrophosphatase (non-canonical NTP hydrolase)
MDMYILQLERKKIADKLDPNMSKGRDARLAKVMEEVGELARCHALMHDDPTVSMEELEDLRQDAVGDIVIALAGYCSASNISLDACVGRALETIKRRWEKQERLGRKVGER